MSALARRAGRPVRAAAAAWVLAVRLAVRSFTGPSNAVTSLVGFPLLAATGGALAATLHASTAVAVVFVALAVCAPVLGVAVATFGTCRVMAGCRAFATTYSFAQVVAVSGDDDRPGEVVLRGPASSVTYLDADCRPQHTATRLRAYEERFPLRPEMVDAFRSAAALGEVGEVVEYYLTPGPASSRVELESATLTFPSFTIVFEAAGAALA